LQCAVDTPFQLKSGARHEIKHVTATRHLRVAFLFLELFMTPLQPIVAELLSRLDDNLREAFEERAGIMEFEAGMRRELAECLAMLDVLRTNPFALTGATALVLERERGVWFVLTTAVGSAQTQFLGESKSIALAELSDVLRQLGGTARLTRLAPAPEK